MMIPSDRLCKALSPPPIRARQFVCDHAIRTVPAFIPTRFDHDGTPIPDHASIVRFADCKGSQLAVASSVAPETREAKLPSLYRIFKAMGGQPNDYIAVVLGLESWLEKRR